MRSFPSLSIKLRKPVCFLFTERSKPFQKGLKLRDSRLFRRFYCIAERGKLLFLRELQDSCLCLYLCPELLYFRLFGSLTLLQLFYNLLINSCIKKAAEYLFLFVRFCNQQTTEFALCNHANLHELLLCKSDELDYLLICSLGIVNTSIRHHKRN